MKTQYKIKSIAIYQQADGSEQGKGEGEQSLSAPTYTKPMTIQRNYATIATVGKSKKQEKTNSAIAFTVKINASDCERSEY